MRNARTALVLAASLAGAALACTHVYGKKVLAVSITSSGGAAALREAIARQVDALYGSLDYGVSYEEVLITGSVNRGPLAFPITKLCDQTYAEAVRQTPISIVPVSGGGSGGVGGIGGSSPGIGWEPIYGYSSVCTDGVCRVEAHIIGWRPAFPNQPT